MKKAKRIVLFILITCLLVAAVARCLDAAINGVNTYASRMIRDLYNAEANIDVLFCGSSLTFRSYDPDVYDKATGDYSFDLAYSSATPNDTFYLLKEALAYNQPKLVVLEVSPERLSLKDSIRAHGLLTDNMKLSANRIEAIQNLYSNTLDGIFPGRRVPINEWTMDFFRTNMEGLKTTDDSAEAEGVRYAGRGYLIEKSSFADGFAQADDAYTWSEDDILPKNLDYLGQTIKLCQDQGIPVIAVFPPRLHAFLMRHVEAHQLFSQWMKAYAEQQNIPFWDGNLLRLTRYPRLDTDYVDCYHMAEGAARYTALVAEIAQAYLDGTFQEKDYFYTDYDELCAAQSTTADAWLTAESDDAVITLHANAVGSQTADFEYTYSMSRDNGESYQLMPEAQNGVCTVPKTDSGNRIIRMEAADRNDADHRICYAVCTIDENGGIQLQ